MLTTIELITGLLGNRQGGCRMVKKIEVKKIEDVFTVETMGGEVTMTRCADCIHIKVCRLWKELQDEGVLKDYLLAEYCKHFRGEVWDGR